MKTIIYVMLIFVSVPAFFLQETPVGFKKNRFVNAVIHLRPMINFSENVNNKEEFLIQMLKITNLIHKLMILFGV